MKKIFAIAMLALFLFNMGGYQLLFQYVIYRSDVAISNQINNNKYQSTDLVDIKIPVHLNIQDWADYQPISGQIKDGATCYNYAELKMTKDTLYLKCIQNTDKAKLISAKIIYTKQLNDIPTNKKAHNVPVKKANTLSDYRLQAFNYHHSRFGKSFVQNIQPVTCKLDRPYISSPGKPPNSMA